MGHGTQVASVVATKTGIAPGVTLGSYRVFGCDGYAADNVLIEAIDRAVRDGCDIINLSLASGSGYADTVSAKHKTPGWAQKGGTESEKDGRDAPGVGYSESGYADTVSAVDPLG